MAELHDPKDSWPELTISITSNRLGAGKSTIAAVLANLLSNVGVENVVIKEGEPHTPEYEAMYNEKMQELRQYLQENGYDEIHNRRITIVEKTV